MASLTPPHTPTHYALKPAARAYASTARLNLQHYLWKDQTGYLVHPSIPLSDANLRIADIGTGTGIWLLDLAKNLPSTAQLDGFDIDIADCPPKEWLPPNVKMHTLDILSEIPQHLVGVYDIVQLRLFQVVVRDNDPVPLLKNSLKLLKPGGYLQWGEYDMTSMKTAIANSSLTGSDLNNVPAFTQKLKKQDTRVGKQNWIPTLATTFAEAGMSNITTSRHTPTQSSLPYQLDVFLLTYEELSYKTLDGMADEQGAKLRELIEKASEEGRKGVAWAMERMVVVGRKAGGAVVDDLAQRNTASDLSDGVNGVNGALVNGKDSGKEKSKTKRQSFMKLWKRLRLG